MSGPDGNGTVMVSVVATGRHVGTDTVTITGRVLTQTITSRVNNAEFDD